MPAIIAISTSSFGKVDRRPLEELERAGFEIRSNPWARKLEEHEAREHVRGVVGLIAGTEKLTAAVMDEAPELAAISRVGAGIDNVDLDAARARDIKVFNTPDAHVDGVAELALGGILASLRGLAEADRRIRRGDWHKPMGGLLRGRTVAVIGLGRVGKGLVRLLKAFQPRVLAVDPNPDEPFARDEGVQYVELDQALAEADVVTLHVPGGVGVRHLIGRDQLAAMKPTALLVNTARGGLVDEAALYEHLRAHPQASAYIDCFEQEPYRGPLTECDNALLTAHIGSYAAEARSRMELEAVRNLLGALSR